MREPRVAGLAVAVAAAVTALGLLPATAGACTCVDPKQLVGRASAAFVGTVVSRGEAGTTSQPPGLRTVTYRLRVERTYKGRLPQEIDLRFYAGMGNTCASEPSVGDRLGLVLLGEPPYGDVSLCNRVSEEDLQRATQPRESPPGRGRTALLATFGFGPRATLAALDRSGRVLAYGAGPGGGALSVCPGSRRFVQAGEELVVRRARDLRVVSRRGLPVEAGAVRCLDASGRTTVVAANADATTAQGIVLLRAGRAARVLVRDRQAYAFLGRRRAVVTSGGEGDVRVGVIDYASGRTRQLVRMAGLPIGRAFDPSERRLALVEADDRRADARRARLRVVDLASGRVRSRALPIEHAGRVLWLSNDRFALLPSPAAFSIPIHDAATLRRTGRLPTFEASAATVLGAAVVGVDEVGRLVRAAPGRAAATRTTLLSSATVASLVAVPGAPELRGASRALPAATARVACAPG